VTAANASTMTVALGERHRRSVNAIICGFRVLLVLAWGVSRAESTELSTLKRDYPTL
jgi:hypothetical protein